jgi:hypothetical protein
MAELEDEINSHERIIMLTKKNKELKVTLLYI